MIKRTIRSYLLGTISWLFLCRTFLSNKIHNKINKTSFDAKNYKSIPSFFLFLQMSFSAMVRPIDLAPVCLSLVEVAVRADHKVLIKVDYNCALIFSDPQGILGQQLRSQQLKFFHDMKTWLTEHLITIFNYPCHS